MSNFGANNRFLQSNLTTNDLATETTLKDIDQILKSGTINVGVTGTADINLTEILGTAITVNSGMVDAGTQRVSIATDDIVIVKTDLDPFNVLTELKFIDGDAVLKDNGPSGLGAQRVTISNDNDPIPTDLTEIGGIGIDIGDGPISTGTQRVVLGNNSVVDVNNDFINSVNISVGSGISNTGTQRVTLATNQANLNNFSNWFMRSSQNTGTPEVFIGTIASVSTTVFRQMSQGFGDDDFFVNPTGADVDLQISCDSVTHTTQTLEVEAWQKDGTIITSNAVTLNGQLAVNITFPASDQVYRIRKLLVLTNTMANGVQTGIGDIVFVSLQGQTLTAGVPDDNIMMTMNLGHGIMRFGGQYYVPPGSVFHLLNANFSADSDSNRATRIALQLKESTATLWFIEFISGVRNSQEFNLPSSNKIEGGTEGMDLRILVSEGDGTGTISNAFTQFHGILE